MTFAPPTYNLPSSWPFLQQGWQCPKCQCIYAPTIPECYRCNKPTQTRTAYNTNEEAGR